MSKLLESVHTLVIDGDMPAKTIASAIGKPYSTLLRECNLLKSWRGNSVTSLFLSIDAPCIKGAADLPSPQPMRGPEAHGDVRPRRGWPRRVLWKGINLCATHTKTL